MGMMSFEPGLTPTEKLLELHNELVGGENSPTPTQAIVECLDELWEMIENSKDHMHTIR